MIQAMNGVFMSYEYSTYRHSLYPFSREEVWEHHQEESRYKAGLFYLLATPDPLEARVAARAAASL